jgi:hypothetical protein
VCLRRSILDPQNEKLVTDMVYTLLGYRTPSCESITFAFAKLSEKDIYLQLLVDAQAIIGGGGKDEVQEAVKTLPPGSSTESTWVSESCASMRIRGLKTVLPSNSGIDPSMIRKNRKRRRLEEREKESFKRKIPRNATSFYERVIERRSF